jgi:hypothetical protein
MNYDETIRRAMARAFFACAWAEQAEETGNAGMLSGRDVLDVMPDNIDPAALHAARTLEFDLLRANACGGSLDKLYRRVAALPRGGADRECTPDLFGHYCAMQAMGTGVGVESFGCAAQDAVRVPYVEFGGHSLERDYFRAGAQP